MEQRTKLLKRIDCPQFGMLRMPLPKGKDGVQRRVKVKDFFTSRLDPCQNLRTFREYGNGVFEMSRRLPIQSDHSPSIIENSNLFRTQVDHRFDGNNKAWLDLRPSSALQIIQNRRIFMKGAPNSMT